MAQFKVVRDFTAKKESKDFKAGELVEMTVKRADEINKQTQAKHELDVLERVVEDNKEVEENKEHADDSTGSAEDKA
ncbi:hypothetical protein COC69_05760 [Bacillus cereus]|uniref:Uncharacterized protein n=1 Tax=Bacillus cereus TaxID=1396 RepID=A0A9X7CRB7_BACCE|nr:hypothetical protein [Bacillus cereus]PGS81636.1 hypothetical protein COC69_05760 [Bacillus cereus]